MVWWLLQAIEGWTTGSITHPGFILYFNITAAWPGVWTKWKVKRKAGLEAIASSNKIYKDIEIYIKRYIKQIEIPITLSSSTVIIQGIHIIHVNYWAHRLRPRCFQARPSSLIRMALNIRKVIHTTYDENQMTHVYDSVCERLGLSRCTHR